MSVKNIDIAKIFNKIADLLEMDEDNRFRVRAYRNAAMTMENLSQDAAGLVKKGEDLTKLHGIGHDLAQKIEDIVNGKEIDLLKRLEEKFPVDLINLERISGLGGKKIKKLYEALNIKNIDDLARAAQEGKIRNIQGFSIKTEEYISEEIKKIKKVYNRMLLSTAQNYAAPIVEYLKKDSNIKNIEIAGSYRRRQETIGDIDILAACDDCPKIMVKRTSGIKNEVFNSRESESKGANLMDEFVSYEEIAQVLSKGETRSSIVLKSGIQIDLRVVPQKSYGAALQYFTGSKAHNVVMRKLAKEKKWKLNEYGLFEGDTFLAGKTEEEIYAHLGLQYIEPELRENRGEIEAAAKGKLPKLIELGDIKGDLHVHTKLTDGRDTLEEMVEAAQKLGYEYIANTEHSKRLTIAKGLDVKKLAEHIKEIDKLNESLNNFIVLKSAEVDILDDGGLDLPDEILKELDIVVCAIHYKFNLPREKQTERILRAMDNPYFNIFAHPSCRLINEREPCDFDMERVMKKAKENNCILEINAQPSRLDLSDIHCKIAKDMGLKFAISTDSHSTDNYNNMCYGIGQARRGWIEADDVINTKSIDELKKLIRKE